MLVGAGAAGCELGGEGVQHPEVEGRGVVHLHHRLELAATSMLGNSTLIRENKERAGLRRGQAWGHRPAIPRGSGCRRGAGEILGWDVPLGALSMLIS